MIDAYTSVVHDGDSFDVLHPWNHNGKTGKGVRIANYNAPERGQPGYDAAKRRLVELILNKWVQLNPKAIDVYGRLVADVFVHGENVVDLLLARSR